VALALGCTLAGCLSWITTCMVMDQSWIFYGAVVRVTCDANSACWADEDVSINLRRCHLSKHLFTTKPTDFSSVSDWCLSVMMALC
jgi:hypothetical protein